MHIDKVKWITARSCGKPKWHSFTSSLGWKGKIWGLDIVSQHVLRRSYLIHWYQLLHPRISFFYGPPFIVQIQFHETARQNIGCMNFELCSIFFFSQEKLPHTLIPVIASTYFVFFYGPHFIVQIQFHETARQNVGCMNFELCSICILLIVNKWHMQSGGAWIFKFKGRGGGAMYFEGVDSWQTKKVLTISLNEMTSNK